MVSERWKFAQKYERQYQLRKKLILSDAKHLIASSLISAKNFYTYLNKFKKITKKNKILEIGSGPFGLIYFLSKGLRVGVDPLADFYWREFSLLQGKEAYSVRALGERLPFFDRIFDVIIIHNVIDHTDSPAELLSEAGRVLKNAGIIYVGVNIYPWLLILMSRLYEALYFLGLRINIPIFQAHPHLFNLRSIELLLSQKGFKLIDRKIGDRKEAKRSFRERKKGWLWKIVSIFAYTGIFYQVLCAKKNLTTDYTDYTDYKKTVLKDFNFLFSL